MTNGMKLYINGEEIKTEREFHVAFSSFLGIQKYYGNNVHALWDVLSVGVERPFHIEWINSENSKKLLGDKFQQIVDIFERTKLQDEKYGWDDKFTYHLG